MMFQKNILFIRLVLKPRLVMLKQTLALVFSEHYPRNPAYRRGRISRPMRIVALIQKNHSSKAKFAKIQTFLCGNFAPFMSTYFHYFSPRIPQNIKGFDIGLLEVEQKTL